MIGIRKYSRKPMVSVQFSSVIQSCPTLWNPMDCSMSDFPVLHYLPEFARIHIHWCYLTISSSAAYFSFCLQSFPASGSFLMNGLFTSGGQSLKASASASILYEYSGLISFRVHWFNLLVVQGTLKSLLQQSQFKTINSLAFNFLYSPTLTSIHDHWKSHSFD